MSGTYRDLSELVSSIYLSDRQILRIGVFEKECKLKVADIFRLDFKRDQVQRLIVVLRDYDFKGYIGDLFDYVLQ